MNASLPPGHGMSAHQEKHSKIGDVLKEAVFGFNDGVVSTFAVIAGLTGGLVEQKIILLGALATLVAGAFSMGLGTYLGSKSAKELYENERRRELKEIKYLPEVEREEIREIYAAKGFKGKLLDEVVEQITSDREVWLKTMMQQELGFAHAPPKPGLNGISMSAAFIIGSAIPTAPYFFTSAQKFLDTSLSMLFVISLAAAIGGLLVAGALKTYFTGRNIFLSALETLIVGALAGSGSYVVGLLFDSAM